MSTAKTGQRTEDWNYLENTLLIIFIFSSSSFSIKFCDHLGTLPAKRRENRWVNQPIREKDDED